MDHAVQKEKVAVICMQNAMLTGRGNFDIHTPTEVCITLTHEEKLLEHANTVLLDVSLQVQYMPENCSAFQNLDCTPSHKLLMIMENYAPATNKTVGTSNVFEK